jgi:hypothetical protein
LPDNAAGGMHTGCNIKETLLRLLAILADIAAIVGLVLYLMNVKYSGLEIPLIIHSLFHALLPVFQNEISK